MLSSQSSWIAKINPLRFERGVDEMAYYEYICLKPIRTTRAAAFIAGFIIYVFYVWDKAIDPLNWEKAQQIRAFVIAPSIWAAATLLLLPRFAHYIEATVTASVIFSVSALTYISTFLRHAFDYNCSGLIIVYLFVVALMPVRLPFYVFIFVITWVETSLAQIVVNDYRPGMLLINNMYIGSSIFLCLFFVVNRELATRTQFLDKRELEASKEQIQAILENLLPKAEIESIRVRRKQYNGRQPKIVLSYRRSDTDAIAGRIRDRLVSHYGSSSIFMDVENMPVGLDFRAQIEKVLSDADLVVFVIGSDWIGNRAGMCRIMEPADPVRIELELALRYGSAVYPVLVNGASMPESSALPESLAEFPFTNALEVDSGRDFSHHMERLIKSINQELDCRSHLSGNRSSGTNPAGR